MIDDQRKNRGWRGALVTNPNCSVIGVAMAVKPLATTFGITQMQVSTLQAVSGAGYPGVPSLDIIDNIIPNIANGTEEEKIESEPNKILGAYTTGGIQSAQMRISAQVTRVPVIDGHTALLSLKGQRTISAEAAIEAIRAFKSPKIVQGLPSAPTQPLVLHGHPERPQPRRDRDAGNGMSTSIGRVRSCPINDVRMVVLSHNTIRGAAGGAILNAELLVAAGYTRSN
jgi:aspartate-semialdehyde dehydrogenase